MCIRDSIHVDLVAHGDHLSGVLDAAPGQLGHVDHACLLYTSVTNDIIGNQDVVSTVMQSDMEKIRLTMEEIDRDSFQAVSYTHLDVYKRQAQGKPIWSACFLHNVVG